MRYLKTFESLTYKESLYEQLSKFESPKSIVLENVPFDEMEKKLFFQYFPEDGSKLYGKYNTDRTNKPFFIYSRDIGDIWSTEKRKKVKYSRMEAGIYKQSDEYYFVTIFINDDVKKTYLLDQLDELKKFLMLSKLILEEDGQFDYFIKYIKNIHEIS
jgi:hypothetical protein